MSTEVYDSYLKKIEEKQQNSKAADKAAYDKLYSDQIKTVQDQYGAQIKDTSESYESALRTNEVQKLINERAVARRNAELGLTDSGLNRTQQTAVQLSYANQKGSLELQRQKAVDTLAATMRAKITSLEGQKAAALQQIDSNYKAAASEQATSMTNAHLDAEAKKEAARIEAEAEANKKASYIIQTNGGALSRDYIGKLEDNNVDVIFDAENGRVTYVDNNSGNKTTLPIGVNPYTGDDNRADAALVKYKAFKNGYQPKGVIQNGHDYGAVEKINTTSYNGNTQNVWKTTDKDLGTHYWKWDGRTNKYIDITYSDEGMANAALEFREKYPEVTLDSRTLDMWLRDNGFSGDTAKTFKAYMQKYGAETSGRR